ncbi:hypothetical protein OROGR_007153 [Orobanche gracilis]
MAFESEVPPGTKFSENLKEDAKVVEENGGINKIDDESGNNVQRDGNEKENYKETDGACNSASPASDENKKENVEEIEKDDCSTLPVSAENEMKNATDESDAADEGLLPISDENEEKNDGECKITEFLLPPEVSDENDKENVEKCEENRLISYLTESEKKALMEFRSKIEADISPDTLPAEREDGKEGVKIDRDTSLWGVPLLPSKEDKCTDTLLFKFLKARDCKPDDALEMLKNTLRWRKENKIDSIVGEDLGIGSDYDALAFMKGFDREGRPICYNVYGYFADEEMYDKTFGDEVSREKFMRWRIQLLEKEILKFDFRPGGICTLLQVNDLKNAPGPSRRDLRLATKRALGIFQDNYPEFVARNIFINVPLWYYAFNAVLSPFLMQRTKSKFVFSRPSRVTETLLKYITAEEITVVYGGLRQQTDPDFSTQDVALDIVVKAGATETIEIPAPEVGNTLIWDLTIIGWDVNYKEEFVPTDEGSYTVIVKKGRKIISQQEPIRNSFKNKEPGKVVITIDNNMFKKKRVLYRYKIKNHSASSST